MDWDRPLFEPAAINETREPSGWKMAEPSPTKITATRIIQYCGANAKPAIPRNDKNIPIGRE